MAPSTPAKAAAPAAAKPAPKPNHPLVTAYLVAYNLASMAGWVYVLYVLCRYLGTSVSLKPAQGAAAALGATIARGDVQGVWPAFQRVLAALSAGGFAGVWPAIETPLKVVQTAATLEIVHSALGLVRSPLATTFIQVLSRLLVLWAIVDLAPVAQASPFVALTAGSWALVEPPRYLMYALSELVDKDAIPFLLTWVRYSLFIVLYPSGITGEVGCLLTALPWVWATRAWSVDLPNAWNWSYNHGLFLVIALLAYIPGSPTMIGHMWKMRSDKLYGKKKAA